MSTKLILSTLRSLPTPGGGEPRRLVMKCLDEAEKLIQAEDAREAEKAERTAQAIETFMESGDVGVLVRFLPPDPPFVTNTWRAEVVAREVGDYLRRKARSPGYKALSAARCFLQALVQELKGWQVGDLSPISRIFEANGLILPPQPRTTVYMTAAQCLAKMARSVPAEGWPHPLTAKLLDAAERGLGDPVRIRQASVALQCASFSGRDALHLATLAARAVKGEGAEMKIAEAVRFAEVRGIDVTGPLVEYILRRKY